MMYTSKSILERRPELRALRRTRNQHRSPFRHCAWLVLVLLIALGSLVYITWQHVDELLAASKAKHHHHQHANASAAASPNPGSEALVALGGAVLDLARQSPRDFEMH